MAYEAFWWVASRIDEQPSQRWRGVLSVVAVDPELGRQLADAEGRAARSVHRYGELVPHVSEVRVAQPTYGPSPVPGAVSAVVVDCPDGRGFGEAEDGTGRVLSTGRDDGRVIARLVRSREFGPWQVAEVRFLDERCGTRPLRDLAPVRFAGCGLRPVTGRRGWTVAPGLRDPDPER